MEASDLEQKHSQSPDFTLLPSGNPSTVRPVSSHPQHGRSNSRDASPNPSPSIHPLNSDMDEMPNGHRRRKSLSFRYEKAEQHEGQQGISPTLRRKSQGGDRGAHIEQMAVEHGYDPETRFSRSSSGDFELDKLSSGDGLTDDEVGLTIPERRKRRRRKRRNTLLDERVVGDTDIGKRERKLADMSVLKSSAINALLIGSWYFFSLSISIYNKWMFSPDHLDFQFPLFTTCMHMLVQFCLATLVLYFIPRFRPRADSISNPHNVRNDSETSKSKGPLMTAKFYLTRIGPCGAATGLDIGLGNMSLKFITLTFLTMCKSSALAFVLLFAFIFRLETPSVKLVLIIAIMTIGVIMMVAGEAKFNILGFVLIISSAFFSGFRWALTQILLLRNPATSNPFSSIFFLAPIMFLSLALLAIPIEGFGPLGRGLGVLTAEKGTLTGISLLLFPGILAFCMTSSEFALLRRTSVVTLSICGIFKEVVTISAAGIAFHDPLTPINISGLLVTIASIAAYNYIKIRKMRSDAVEQIKENVEDEEREGMLQQPDEAEEVRERRSTSSMVLDAVRSSLTLVTPATSAGNASDGRERQSPLKRQQDLE